MHKPSLRYFNSFIYYYIYYMRFCFFIFFKAKPFILFFSSYPYGEKWFGLSFCCVTLQVTQTKGYSLFFLVFFLLLKRAKKKHTNRSKYKETGQTTFPLRGMKIILLFCVAEKKNIKNSVFSKTKRNN